jgi:drug/metabolite transporter (DMT)-like permease
MKKRTLGFASCTLASALWGCGFFFGKIALAEMNVGAMVLYRFAFATLALVPLLITHPARFTRKEWRTVLLCALLGIPLQFLIQFSGLARTTVSHASLMVGTMPVILAVGAALFAHERMDATGWLGLAGSTAGAAFIALGAHTSHNQNDNPTLTGDLLVVLSLIIALGWVLLNKHLMQRHSAITVSAYGISLGTLMLLILVPILYPHPFGPLPIARISHRAWLALAASGLLCTASTTILWNWGLTQVPASQAGVLLNMEPLIGSLLGVFLLHETLGPSARLGALLILAASLVITTQSRTRTRTREQLPLT